MKNGTSSSTSSINSSNVATPTNIRQNIIGSSNNGHYLQGPFGKKPLVYADSTASGKSLYFIENYIQQSVMPFYANTHTEASATALQTSTFREQARDYIRHAVNAPKEEYSIIFTGSGSTSAIDKLSRVLGLSQQVSSKEYVNKPLDQPIVFVGPYEHHSNEVLWRETQAHVVVIPECPITGSIDIHQLETELKRYKDHAMKVGSFSAASNVTGIRSDTKQISSILHKYGAIACFDFAAAGPHVRMDMKGHDIDVMYLSIHKFVGGPQTPGLLVARQSIFSNTDVPTVPGGGTVDYVQRHSQAYSKYIEHREEGGTPAIIESIRAGLVLQLHSLVGRDGYIEDIETRYLNKAISSWKHNPNIILLGNIDSKRVSIVSFMIKVPTTTAIRDVRGNSSNNTPGIRIGGNDNDANNNDGNNNHGLLHYNFVTALLNDVFGIQSRGGCSCAAPYAHLLWNVDQPTSDAIRHAALHTKDGMILKPGWARIAFSYYMDESTVDYIIDAVNMIASEGYKLLPWYKLNPETSMWTYIGHDTDSDGNIGNHQRPKTSPVNLWNLEDVHFESPTPVMKMKNFLSSSSKNKATNKDRSLKKAKKLFRQVEKKRHEMRNKTVLSPVTEQLRWFVLPEEVVALSSSTTTSPSSSSWSLLSTTTILRSNTSTTKSVISGKKDERKEQKPNKRSNNGMIRKRKTAVRVVVPASSA